MKMLKSTFFLFTIIWCVVNLNSNFYVLFFFVINSWIFLVSKIFAWNRWLYLFFIQQCTHSHTQNQKSNNFPGNFEIGPYKEYPSFFILYTPCFDRMIIFFYYINSNSCVLCVLVFLFQKYKNIFVSSFSFYFSFAFFHKFFHLNERKDLEQQQNGVNELIDLIDFSIFFSLLIFWHWKNNKLCSQFDYCN